MLFETHKQACEALAEIWRWPHFSVEELACRCRGRFCDGEYWHDGAFLDALEMLRAQIGAPLRVTSGHRCRQWNAAVGGAPRSEHKTIAADIAIGRHARHELKDAAVRAGFSGIGMARTFLHIDRRSKPARWYYKGSEAVWKTS